MTTYDLSKITDAKILADKPITQGQGRALRDNLLAVIEGDASAPRIALGAIAFGSDADGAFTNASAAPTLPGFYDYSSFLRTTPVTFPNYSIIRVQGNFTLSALMTISPVLAANYDGLVALGAARGNNGSDAGTPGGGGSVGAGGTASGILGGTGIGLDALNRFWVAKRGFIGGLGGTSVDAVSKAGGALLLIVSGDIDLSGGTIDASAVVSVANSGYGAGAGGGSIGIITPGFIRAGTLKARGGNAAGVGGSNCGGGGGGFVQTAASSYPIAQTIDVTFGQHLNAGANGAAGASVQETLTAARIRGLLYR